MSFGFPEGKPIRVCQCPCRGYSSGYASVRLQGLPLGEACFSVRRCCGKPHSGRMPVVVLRFAPAGRMRPSGFLQPSLPGERCVQGTLRPDLDLRPIRMRSRAFLSAWLRVWVAGFAAFAGTPHLFDIGSKEEKKNPSFGARRRNG